MGGDELAQGIWRKGSHFRRTAYLSARALALESADGNQRARYHHDRACTNAVGYRRAEEALPSTDTRRRRNLVRGNVGAWGRIGPGRDTDPRGAAGRFLHRQWAK